MGCFLACFGGAKDRKRRRRIKRSPRPAARVSTPSPLHLARSNYQPVPACPLPLVKEEAREEAAAEAADVEVVAAELRESPGKASPGRKKVTFDLNVRTYEHVAVCEEAKDLVEDEEVGDEAEGGRIGAEGSGYNVSPGSRYRYQNCESSDDEGVDNGEEEEEEYADDDEFDEEEDEDAELDVMGPEEESYDSFFSLPMVKVKPQEESGEVESPMPVALSAVASARDRNQYVHSVLNPVENLTQWKEAKFRAVPLKTPSKENASAEVDTKKKSSDKENTPSDLEAKITGFSPGPTFKSRQPQKLTDCNSTPSQSTKQEMSVDASLSTWLVSSESTKKASNSQWSNSSVSREEQPILGALTVEDLKQSSVTSSPRRSPVRNPDDIPIVGTVGSYWNARDQRSESKGIPNTTSKYREDRKVNWHSTPFEARLERALNKANAES